MTADAMLAVIRERYPEAIAYRNTGWNWCVFKDGRLECDNVIDAGRTRWQAIFAAYRAVRASQGKAVIEA